MAAKGPSAGAMKGTTAAKGPMMTGAAKGTSLTTRRTIECKELQKLVSATVVVHYFSVDAN